MSKPVSSRTRRTYFNNPLIEESLQHLPAAIEHTTSVEFRQYLEQHLHHNSTNTRHRYAQYISQRFSHDGQMNLDLARAIALLGDGRAGREILYFELIRSVPVLQEIAQLWLAEIPEIGVERDNLLGFLEPRLGGRSVDEVAGAAVSAFRRCGKLTSPKTAVYAPVWSEPPIEAFCYVLAQLQPEPSMVRSDLFAGQPILRAMLWPRPCIDGLLRQAEAAGHVSKISSLDQYHQFTLTGSKAERLNLLHRSDKQAQEKPDSITKEAGEKMAAGDRPASRRRSSVAAAKAAAAAQETQRQLFPSDGKE